MLTASLLRSLTAGSNFARLRRERRMTHSKKQAVRGWAVERLEDRTLLSTFVVNTISDLDVASGLPVGQESLRQAIEDANADTSSDVDTIDFNIPGSGVQDIRPLSQLPIITHPAIIDGYSQPGSSPNNLATGDDAVLLIELDGSLAGAGAYGLVSGAANSTVRGLNINRFNNAGIFMGSGSDHSTIQGNFIGTDPTGEQALGNGYGVGFYNSNYGLVGTDGDGINDLAERNIVSGNLGTGIGISASFCVVAGNYIGTDAKGTMALGNAGVGVILGAYFATSGNRIGANGHDLDPAAERNVISANQLGIEIWPFGGYPNTQNVIAGNFIGTDATGTQRLGNGGGIAVASDGNLIGTDGDGVGDASERNIISANQGDGVEISGNNNVVAGNFIGTDVTGTQPLGNYRGINVGYGSSNRIGTDGQSADNVGERNIVSCNSYGIVLQGQGDKLVAGNFIGTDVNGNPISNPAGGRAIDVAGDSNDQIGGSPALANTIANYTTGVVVEETSIGISIRANSIYNIDSVGIDLAPPFGPNPNTPGGPHTGPNNLQNYPVLSTAIGSATTQVIGTFNSTPNTTFTLDFYANDPDKGNAGAYGPSQYYLGSTTVTTDGSGNVSFNATGLAAATPGEWISATATDPGGNTSEFSLDVQAIKANTATSLTSSENPAVFGQSITFMATVGAAAPASGVPTGTVNFLDGSTVIDTAVLNGGTASFTTTSLAVGNHTITAVYSGDSDFNASVTSTSTNQMVNQDSTTTTVSASSGFANFGQSVAFTATVTANVPGSGTPTGTVDFYDTTTGMDLTPGGIALSSRIATFSTTSLVASTHVIKATYSGDTNFTSSTASSGSIAISQSIIVLDPTAGAALSLSGSASIDIAGAVVIDSSSTTAILAKGNTSVTAGAILIHGDDKQKGNATLTPAPITGAPTISDPLAGLPLPALPTGLSNLGAEVIKGTSVVTLQPGLYSQISISGKAKVTLNPGTYVIQGGGFSAIGNSIVTIGSGTSLIALGQGIAVDGSANVSGSGVTLFNLGSGYTGTTDGGSFGSISLRGNGTISLTPPSSGTYAGILIYQARDNSAAMTLAGNAMVGVTGTIYAPAAALVASGKSQIGSLANPVALVVDTLTISSDAIANGLTLSSPAGTVAYTPAQILQAYGVNNLPYDGTGQTIAIVDAYDDPNILQAVDAFDSQFGLTATGQSLYTQYGPATSFLTVLNQYGQATSLPSTDPGGVGTDNWEVEESLDVEWAHAVAPGARIILVEANSQSLSDLMAGVATAASQPGVSVVSMSWGFAEGQQAFASDEAMYDSYFNVPGVTFVASTGDYGAADPEYPAFSPNVVSVGGTSLTLNGNNSYGSETGWGYQSSSVGAFIGSGGGLSLYEPEPAYQQGIQSTGLRANPDVSLVADPATGAWIADPYNLDPSNPFEIVGGTSLSAPVWAGLLALVNQGSAVAGGSALNRSSPTETAQALYSLPQNDYNAITSGFNGYSAGAGYNLVTGLGTPVANLLVSDLVAYQSGTFVASGPTVSPLQNANLVNTGGSDAGTTIVFSVFDSMTVPSHGYGNGVDHATGHGLSSPARRPRWPAF